MTENQTEADKRYECMPNHVILNTTYSHIGIFQFFCHKIK